MTNAIEDDVKNLKINLIQSFPELDLSITVVGKQPVICVTLDKAREATVEEFKSLKIFAVENGYELDEETDTTPQQKLFYYMLRIGAVPF